MTNAQHYDAAFQKFFQRLAADGITPDNTLFVISAEENDQFAGANVGRATQPTPAGCDGVTARRATTPPGQIGELQANIKGLLSGTAVEQRRSSTSSRRAQSIYVHGQPAANDPAVRQLERDTAAMTDARRVQRRRQREDRAVPGRRARAARTAHADGRSAADADVHAVPEAGLLLRDRRDANVSINSSFAYDHGYYSPNIDITWVGIAGPGVADRRRRRPAARRRQPAERPGVDEDGPGGEPVGTWVEETDIRPTMLYLLGLTDDYQSDGHVITQALTSVPSALAATADLAKGYDQINSSVGQFATDTLIADSKALASGSASDDSAYQAEQQTLQQLADDRDAAAAKIKQTLADAAAGKMPNHGEIQSGLAHVKELLKRAHTLAGS